jgi:Lambda phage tail tape-measure protein (Tape_meas_lam_C)
MAENLDINVNVNTTTAQRNLAALNKSVQTLESTFGKLQNALAGLAIGATINRINSFALGVKQASSASEIAIATILDFSNAVGAVGGNADRAVGDVIDFVAGLRAAYEGSASAQIELSKVGVTLQDLATLSNEDIFKKTIQGLAKIEDSSLRNSLALKLLGKNFKDIDIRAVAQQMGQGGGANASAIAAAAGAQQALITNLNNLRQALLNVLEPLNSIAKGINISVSAFESLMKAVAAAVGAYLIFGKAIPAVTSAANGILSWAKSAGGIFAALTGTISKAFSEVVGFFRMWGRVITGAQSAASIFGGLVGTLALLGRAFLRLLGVAGIIISIAEAVNFLSKQFFNFDIIDAITTKISSMYNAAKKFFNIQKQIADDGSFDRAEMAKLQRQQAQAQAVKKTIDAQRQQKLELDKQLRSYQSQNAEITRQMTFQNSLIGMDETRANRLQKLFDLETNYLNEVRSIQQKYNDLKAAAAVGTDEEKAAFQAFAAVYESTLASIKAEYQGQVNEVNNLINQEEVLKAKEKDRQNILEAITQQMERQGILAQQLVSANDKLKDVQFEAAQMKRSPLEQNIARIQEDARKAALEAGRAFAQAFEDSGDGLTPERAQELANGLSQIADRYKAIADAQTANLLASRTWEQGWKEAFNNYMENATNAAKQAGDVFNSITSNMERAIDNFVTTGKFSFGDLARSIIQDLIKIELKAQATAMFKAIAGTAGSFLGSIFGFAQGGTPPLNKPSIVGENGPELFVPRTAGTIIPNHALQGGGGGMMNAPITNNYITNNISALDAKSVAQLFAENRKTLLGTVRMAEKELPYGNR